MRKILALVFALSFTLTMANACLDKNGKPMPGLNCIGGKMSEAKEVRASHILVPTEKEAQNLKTKIENGESFADLAAKYSSCPSGKNGGDLGYFSRGQMVKPFEDAAFSLPVGQVSDPVKTQFGYHLIQVTGRK